MDYTEWAEEYTAQIKIIDETILKLKENRSDNANKILYYRKIRYELVRTANIIKERGQKYAIH